MSGKIGQRLSEIVDFDFSKPNLTQLVREQLTVKLSGQFLEPFSTVIENSEREADEEEKEEEFVDKLDVMKKLQSYLQSDSLTKELYKRNLKCNAVLPYINTAPLMDWEKRDVPIVASFGFPKIVPKNLLSRQKSNKLFKFLTPRLPKIFPNHKISEIDHNSAAKVPYLLFDVDDVSVILRISMKPFCSPQFLSQDIVEVYEKYDNRFVTIAAYFHNFLKAKVINKREQKKQKSVIPKLCSIEMMVIHCFKHYNLLPSDLNIDNLMSNLSVSSSPLKSISLGVLFFLFVDYYLEVVDLEKDYIEISTGEVVEKLSIGLTNKNILSISDIFDDHIPGERVNDILIFKRILKACFLAIQKFLNNRTGDLLNDLRVIPLCPRIEL